MLRRSSLATGSVMRERYFFVGGEVQLGGEALGEATAVDEDHGRAMGANQLDDAGRDEGPDRRRAHGFVAIAT